MSKRSVAFNWGREKVRGLNIGGWLVLEPWITPSIFQNVDQSLGIVDEFTLTQQLGTETAYSILKPHVSPCPAKYYIRTVLISGLVG
jgi:glucan 1,3-beta-glucosidase